VIAMYKYSERESRLVEEPSKTSEKRHRKNQLLEVKPNKLRF